MEEFFQKDLKTRIFKKEENVYEEGKPKSMKSVLN